MGIGLTWSDGRERVSSDEETGFFGDWTVERCFFTGIGLAFDAPVNDDFGGGCFQSQHIEGIGREDDTESSRAR